jgi:hypothetical protein
MKEKNGDSFSGCLGTVVIAFILFIFLIVGLNSCDFGQKALKMAADRLVSLFLGILFWVILLFLLAKPK